MSTEALARPGRLVATVARYAVVSLGTLVVGYPVFWMVLQSLKTKFEMYANVWGLPQQVYTLPPEAINAYSYPEPVYAWNPWFYGPFFVGSPVFLTNGVRHHHHFHFNGSHKGSARHGGYRGGRK